MSRASRVFALTLAGILSVPFAPLASSTAEPMPRTDAAQAADEMVSEHEKTPPAKVDASVVRVNATAQTYDFQHPWAKRSPSARRGIGVVISGGRVLATSELVANHTYVELEKPDGSAKCPASVDLIDYDCNLAILSPQDPLFLDGTVPLELDRTAKVGDGVQVVQLESNGSVAATDGIITTITVGGYPADGVSLLMFKVSAPLQYRDNSFTMPVVRSGALNGLLVRYETRSQTADLVPAPVIAAFLARAAKKPYQSIARAGISYSPTRDPQLRRYLGLNGQKGGVYISSVSHGCSAEKAGMKKGDVLLAVGGHDLDADGNYAHPLYGRIPFGDLFTTGSNPGDKLILKVFRDGKTIEFPIVLAPRDPKSVVSESYSIGEAPRYFILGGLVFQELSRAYLREWGSGWKQDAPSRLVYLDEYQEELPPDRGKIVILSSVLPSDATMGYEDLDNLVVTKVNGKQIKRLEDLAEAVKTPADGFHRIEFDSNPRAIYLDAAQADAAAQRILVDYDIPALQHL